MFNSLQADNLHSQLWEVARQAVREPGSIIVRGVRVGKTITLRPEPLTADRLRVICTGREEYTGHQSDDFNECNRLTLAGNAETKLVVVISKRSVLKLEHTHGRSISDEGMSDGPEWLDTGPVRIGQEQCLRSTTLLLVEHSLFKEYREMLRECRDGKVWDHRQEVYRKLKEIGRQYARPMFLEQRMARARLIGHCLGSFGSKVTTGVLTILEAMLRKLRDTKGSLGSSGVERRRELYEPACRRWDERCEVIDRFIQRLLELDWSVTEATHEVERLEREEFSAYINMSYTAVYLARLMQTYPGEAGKQLLEILRGINLTFKGTPVAVVE